MFLSLSYDANLEIIQKMDAISVFELSDTISNLVHTDSSPNLAKGLKESLENIWNVRLNSERHKLQIIFFSHPIDPFVCAEFSQYPDEMYFTIFAFGDAYIEFLANSVNVDCFINKENVNIYSYFSIMEMVNDFTYSFGNMTICDSTTKITPFDGSYSKMDEEVNFVLSVREFCLSILI